MTDLRHILLRSHDLGLLGPGRVADQLEHARSFVEFLSGRVPADAQVVDLGTGGGVPGVVIAAESELRVVMVEASERRIAFLRWAILELGLRSASVVHGRAEEVARRADLREAADVVTARSFAEPATTAECAAGLVAVGGRLVVSEPPGGLRHERWPVDGLAQLGFAEGDRATGERWTLQEFRKVGRCDDQTPRTGRLLAKRPLWSV